MTKVFIILSASMILFASCKKNTQDLKPATDPVTPTLAAPVSLAAKFSYTVQDPINIFEYQPITFQNLSTGATSCVWEFGNATKTQDKEPTMSYHMHGYYTVKLTVFDGKGNENSVTQDISILCLFANGIHPTPGAGG